ncbi:hypothetical protein BH11ARM2_BH11ARM2_32910 [soil metagenome]
MFFALLLALQAPDPLRLPIGRPGETQVRAGQAIDLRTGKAAAPWAEASAGKLWVFLGEQHATAPHQRTEGEVVEALAQSGRKVAVGVEMLQRPVQPVLDRYINGEIDEATFLKDADWKGQWGFDFAFYRPLFEVCRRNKVPMVALNVPRAWVRAVGKGGLDALPEEGRKGLPWPIEVGAGQHRTVFEAMMGGHPAGGPPIENMLAAQTIWDEGMADTAIRWRATHPVDTFVVVAGSGHMLYGQGINLRVARRTGQRGLNVLMVEAKEPVTVANGAADVVIAPK